MAVPATTARATPEGTRIGDGYQTLIAFAADPNISFWEKTVTPPGMDGGDAVDNTTMHNVTYRTFSSRALVTMTPASTTVAFDPLCYNSIIAIINVEGAITVHFPNADTLDFYGYLKSFIPGPFVDGTQPEASVEIVPTNWDPVNNVEAAPNYISASGTDQV